MERQNIESQYKWTIDEMYPKESDLNKDIDKVKALIEKVGNYKGKLSESKENLYNALHTSEEAGRVLEKLYVYTHMKSHEDTRVNSNQGKATKIDMLSTELSMATSYMVPEIINIDEAKLNEFLNDENTIILVNKYKINNETSINDEFINIKKKIYAYVPYDNFIDQHNLSCEKLQNADSINTRVSELVHKLLREE